MLEAMEMYQTPGAGTKVTKLDVREVLGRTEGTLFEKLKETRQARLGSVLDGKDPLAAGLEGDNGKQRSDDIAFSLNNKVVVITGASRGIGEAIAVRFAGKGAKIVILAQSTTENPSLPGTVQSALKQCIAAGGDAIAIKTDIADEGQVQAAVKDAMKHYGGVVDILVNCASVHFPQRCTDMDVKRYDALANVNVKGSIIVSAACMPYLMNSTNPHILTIAPAPRADREWLSPHAAYSSSKIAMGFISRKIHTELNSSQNNSRVACNTLWPRYAVATAATNFIGGETLVNLSRTPASVADAAFRIVSAPSRNFSNNHFVDQDVLVSIGITDFASYNVDPELKQPVDDFFLFSSERNLPKYGVVPRNAGTGEVDWAGKGQRPLDLDKREVVLVLIDRRDIKARGVHLFNELRMDHPNRKVVCIVHMTEPKQFFWQFESDQAHFRSFHGDLRDAAVIAKLVEEASRAFFGIDAVVDMLLNQPLRDWENPSLVDATAVTFSRHFDVTVRASFLALRDILPHLTKSSGSRRVISITPPPRCDVFDAGPQGVVSLARAVRGLHLKGVAAELAEVRPHITLIGLWSDELVKMLTGDFAATATARAINTLLDAPEDEKKLPSGSFWRAEDVIEEGSKMDVNPKTTDSTEPTYVDSTFEFPDIAEELARELKRTVTLKLTSEGDEKRTSDKGNVKANDDELGDWQMV